MSCNIRCTRGCLYPEMAQATLSIICCLYCDCRPPSAFNQCLTVLEHASFACPANEQRLVELHMESGSIQPSLPPAILEPRTGQLAESACGQPFPDWLVQSIQHMQSTSTPDPDGDNHPDWSCIQSALSVLINMSHNNTTGCEAVVAAGGLQMATDIISNSMLRHDMCDAATDGGVTPRRALAHTRQHVLTDVGPITAGLGLLINLVENCNDTRQQLKAMKLQDSSPSGDVPQLLCRLMQVSVQHKHFWNPACTVISSAWQKATYVTLLQSPGLCHLQYVRPHATTPSVQWHRLAVVMACS